MKNKKVIIGFILAFTLIGLTSCAPEGASAFEYGFFGGIWHGFIFGFTLVGKFFGLDIGIYADHNSGFFYWLGFIIGLPSLAYLAGVIGFLKSLID